MDRSRKPELIYFIEFIPSGKSVFRSSSCHFRQSIFIRKDRDKTKKISPAQKERLNNTEGKSDYRDKYPGFMPCWSNVKNTG
jgi:hypothetical protein